MENKASQVANMALVEHRSTMVLPFRIHDRMEGRNPFNTEANDEFESIGQGILDLKANLEKYNLLKKASLLDKKHHRFIKNYISNYSDQDSRSFLKLYKINSDQIFQSCKQKLHFNLQKDDIFIDNDWKVKIHEQVSIYLNEYAGIGYLTIGIDIRTNNIETDYFNIFSKLEFFRYYLNENIKENKKKYQLKVIQHTNTEPHTEILFTIQDFITASIENILPYISFVHIKPIMLHLFNPHHEVNPKCGHDLYKILRIPPSQSSWQKLETVSIDSQCIQNAPGSFIYVMNEGACIIELTQMKPHYEELQKKYLPSFLLSLNQREIMIEINRSISMLTYKQMVSLDEETVSKLDNIKLRVTIFQLTQMFYSISFYDEIDIFFKKLQSVFNIDSLLKDNMGSINEITILLANKSEKDRKAKLVDEAKKENERMRMEAEKTKNYEFAFILFGLFLSIIQCVTGFVEDDIRFSYKWYFISPIFLSVSFIGLLVIRQRGNNNSK